MFRKTRHLPRPAHARQGGPFLGQGRRRDGHGTDWAVVRTTARRERRWRTLRLREDMLFQHALEEKI